MDTLHIPSNALGADIGPWFPETASLDVMDELSALDVRLVVVDTETTGLNPEDGAQITEIAYYCLNTGLGGVFVPAHTLDGADSFALEISRYEDRLAWQPQDDGTKVRALHAFLGGDGVKTHIVGSNPAFDCKHLNVLFAKYDLPIDPWNHRKIDPCAAAYWVSDVPVGRFTGLAESAKITGVPLFDHHSAWADVEATAGVFHALEAARR